MGTKNNPGTFDCYEAADPDEPMFILLARDIQSPSLVEAWANDREVLIRLGLKPKDHLAKVEEARKCAADMRKYFDDLKR